MIRGEVTQRKPGVVQQGNLECLRTQTAATLRSVWRQTQTSQTCLNSSHHCLLHTPRTIVDTSSLPLPSSCYSSRGLRLLDFFYCPSHFLLLPPVGGRCIAISVSICLAICLCVCPSAYRENCTSKFHEIFYTCYLWPWLDDDAIRYVLPVLWMSNVLRNGTNGPKSSTTLFRRVRQKAASGTKFDVYNCLARRYDAPGMIRERKLSSGVVRCFRHGQPTKNTDNVRIKETTWMQMTENESQRPAEHIVSFRREKTPAIRYVKITMTGGRVDVFIRTRAWTELNNESTKLWLTRADCPARPGRSTVPVSGLAAEHGGPQLHELSLVEAAVLVAVEHLHQRDGSRPVDAHHLADRRHNLVLAEYAVAVLVQLVETLRQIVVTATHAHTVGSNPRGWGIYSQRILNSLTQGESDVTLIHGHDTISIL